MKFAWLGILAAALAVGQPASAQVVLPTGAVAGYVNYVKKVPKKAYKRVKYRISGRQLILGVGY